MKNLSKLARAYALKNALAHEGDARQGAVIAALFNEGLKRSEVSKYSKEISEIVLSVNTLSREQQEKEFSKVENLVSERSGREGLPELPEAKKGKVVMRFAPSASGPLHVGHALTASLSFLFVKKYGGKFYVRIEDTNPENIYPPAYEMISHEAAWLFEDIAQIVVQSDRMELYYDYAEKLLKKGKAYICTCSAMKFKKLIDDKKACPCRKLSVKENLERWRKMLGSSKTGEPYKPGEAVLRFKSNIKDKNPAMRDFPLARINLEKHPRQGNKYRVWPLMNLAVSVDDIEMKMTHIIRAKDHRDNALRQKKIYAALGLAKNVPWTGFLGRIKFKDMDLSTTKMRQEIDSGKYSGWDDKRLPTLEALKKRGYRPEAFWKFAEQIGLSENDKVMDRKEFFRLLDSFNRRELSS